MGFFKTLTRAADMIFNSDEYNNVGSTGERFTFNELKAIYPKKQILRNVYLKKENGEYTEIDLLVINPKGIFVFESKNYSGWIFGDEKQTNWMQTLKTGPKNKFFNPIMQNKVHIKALKNHLKNYPDLQYYSVTVFSERCELKDITCTETDTYVVKRENLQTLLKSIEKQKPIIINQDTLQQIIIDIEKYSRPENEVKAEHLKQLEENFKKCPKCKSELIERSNKNTGEIFYGCSNFPKCRYTTNEIKQTATNQ